MKKKIKIKFIEKTIDNEIVKIQAKTIGLSGFKALDENGTFEAYASVFGNVDSYGEVVDPGAFKEWLAEHFDGGKNRYPKCVWNHNWDEPIAATIECREDERGLYVKGKFVLEVQRAKEIFALMKEGVITDFSFGFRVLDDEVDGATGIRHLKKIAIYEYSPVLVGANPAATLLGVKSANDLEGEAKEEEIEVPVKDPDAEDAPPADDPAATDPEKDPKEPKEETPGGDTETPGSGDAPAPGSDDEKGIKAGRVLSAKNRGLIQEAVDGMRNATDALEALLEATEDDDSGKSSDTSPVDGRDGKGSETTRVVRAILRDARKADKILEKVILRGKEITR